VEALPATDETQAGPAYQAGLVPVRAAALSHEEYGHHAADENDGDRRLVDPLAPVPAICDGVRRLLITPNTSMSAEPARNLRALEPMLLRTVICYRRDRDGNQSNCRDQRDVTGSNSNLPQTAIVARSACCSGGGGIEPTDRLAMVTVSRPPRKHRPRPVSEAALQLLLTVCATICAS
jgi:hypothetical protein